jgi:hypothetical protein
MKTVSEILSAAADLIEPEGAWTKGVDARDDCGEETGIYSPDAKCFCASGAIYRVAGHPLRSQSLRFLERQLGVDDIPPWNDESSQSEVVAKLREAAERAREQGL